MNSEDVINRRIANLQAIQSIDKNLIDAIVKELLIWIEEKKDSLVFEKGEGVLTKQAEIKLLYALIDFFIEGVTLKIEELREYVKSTNPDEGSAKHSKRRKVWQMRGH